MQTPSAAASPPDSPPADAASVVAARLPFSWKLCVLILLVLYAARAARDFVPYLLRDDLFRDDARQLVFWTYRYADPALFPNDAVADFFQRPLFSTLGYKAIARLLVPYFDAQAVSEAVAMALSVPLVIGAYLLGRACSRDKAELVGVITATIVIVHQMFFSRLMGGFPRSYALPILVLCMWALIARRLGWLGVFFIAAALFYPQTILVPGLCAGAVLLMDLWRRRLPRSWPLLLVGGLVAIAIVLLCYAPDNAGGVGPLASGEVARSMPEFGPGGRMPFFVDDPAQFWLKNNDSGLRMSIGDIALSAGALAVCLAVFGWRFMPRENWWLLICSLAIYGVAHLVVFRLHFPSRYVYNPLIVFRLIWIASVVAQLEQLLRPRLAGLPQATQVFLRRWLPVGIGGTLAVVLCLAAVKNIRRAVAAPVKTDFEALVAYLKSLPSDTLIAAHPTTADNLPLRAQRSVLINTECSVPLWTGYNSTIVRPRLRDTLRATYASSFDDVSALSTTYGVDVFVVDATRYEDEASIRLFEPYSSENRAMVERGRREGFALLNPPAGSVLFASGPYSVVQLRP